MSSSAVIPLIPAQQRNCFRCSKTQRKQREWFRKPLTKIGVLPPRESASCRDTSVFRVISPASRGNYTVEPSASHETRHGSLLLTDSLLLVRDESNLGDRTVGEMSWTSTPRSARSSSLPQSAACSREVRANGGS